MVKYFIAWKWFYCTTMLGMRMMVFGMCTNQKSTIGYLNNIPKKRWISRIVQHRVKLNISGTLSWMQKKKFFLLTPLKNLISVWYLKKPDVVFLESARSWMFDFDEYLTLSFHPQSRMSRMSSKTVSECQNGKLDRCSERFSIIQEQYIEFPLDKPNSSCWKTQSPIFN